MPQGGVIQPAKTDRGAFPDRDRDLVAVAPGQVRVPIQVVDLVGAASAAIFGGELTRVRADDQRDTRSYPTASGPHRG